MSDIELDSGAPESVASQTVAPNGEPQGSTPAPGDTPASEAEAKPETPEERQSRSESRRYASQRRELRDLTREVGRLQGMLSATRPPQQAEGTPAQGDTSQVDDLRREMAQRETERVARSFWSGVEKEAKEKGLADFAEARDALQSGEVPTNPAMSHYVTDLADNKAALVVWLANNPDEAERIAGLNPLAAGAELAKADARLGKPSARTTKAPAPVRTVGGTSAATSDPGKMSMEDYAVHRGFARRSS